ncbi:hypothetical protein SAMN05443633_103356 [Chryseobacterium arachidis]|uniref:Uncharacterized protein n=1 Tax=Chryseobacterium arachidis TaxID=1416778 RepID=A0A1M5A3T6_9FLAO|nr:hypothetical protein SAMN05443633_103356 [Chryseobacterium arachidis]
MEFFFDILGNFVRWIVIYRCDTKQMNKIYTTNPKSEGLKNSLAGILLLVLIVITGVALFQ